MLLFFCFHFPFVFCLFVCQAFVEKLTAVNSRIIMSSLPHAKQQVIMEVSEFEIEFVSIAAIPTHAGEAFI